MACCTKDGSRRWTAGAARERIAATGAGVAAVDNPPRLDDAASEETIAVRGSWNGQRGSLSGWAAAVVAVAVDGRTLLGVVDGTAVGNRPPDEVVVAAVAVVAANESRRQEPGG